MSREVMEYDVVIVGAGPAGLSCAIRLKQLCQQHSKDLSVCILEKGASVGAHILSGAAFEPRALNELIPNWQNKNAPLNTPANKDYFIYLTKNRSFQLPTPTPMKNHGNYIISLADLCRWLAEEAISLGVEIYPGFAGNEIYYENNHVAGVITGDVGIDKQGNKTDHYQTGMIIKAKQTIIAEGCRGSMAKQLIQRYKLDENSNPQTYGIGIKELWEIPAKQHRAGTIIHTIGWPLDHKTYGGSFLYHFDKKFVSIGFAIGLDYKNPYLNPYEEFQRFKTHSFIKKTLNDGQRIAYGARALNEGGFQSLPKLTFPGGLLIGDSAGFLNTPKIKGSHTAMKSGMTAAETVFNNLTENNQQQDYQANLQNTWLWSELYKARNIRPGFNWGLWPGLANAAIDNYLFRGHAPWTLKNHADHLSLQSADKSKPINYPAHDGKISFDLLSSVYLSNTYHEENQPCHLKLLDPNKAIDINFNKYASPETRYCPAGVYEIIYNKSREPQFHINAQNCIHCKTCDIKDPTQNINWVPPEGGGGPNYPNM